MAGALPAALTEAHRRLTHRDRGPGRSEPGRAPSSDPLVPAVRRSLRRIGTPYRTNQAKTVRLDGARPQRGHATTHEKLIQFSKTRLVSITSEPPPTSPR